MAGRSALVFPQHGQRDIRDEHVRNRRQGRGEGNGKRRPTSGISRCDHRTFPLLGAAAGAGGIGFDLFMASSFYLDLREVGVITSFILVFAIALELAATRLKAKMKLNV